MPGPPPPLRVHTLIDSLTWGGAEMLLSDLAAGALSGGVELSVGYLIEVDGSPAARPLRELGVVPELVPVRRLLEAGAVPRLRRHLARVAPDIVHTHLGLADVVGTLAARSLSLPVVSTIHLVASQPTGRDDGARGRARQRVAALARRRASARVIAVSDAARAAYLATGWDRSRHVVTVRNGIARTADPADGVRLRAELGIAPEEIVLSTVTVLRPGKGHELVVEAVRELLPRFPRLRLLILGDGPSREDVERLARPLGDAAILTGHRSDVMAVLAATDVLLHPTRMDAFPTTLLEAAAASVPVIASAVGGVPEIVTDRQTGLLLEAPASAGELTQRLALLLADAGLRAALGAGARQRFEREFTAERWVARLRRVYDDALADGRRRARS
ncbi:MAG TPA: glycosyltransferase family 4 protein [Solirubrobacteraceae bacterium]|nr:glycosyltransferase family 4 protein [Solirubrobacteraceae bacterium]